MIVESTTSFLPFPDEVVGDIVEAAAVVEVLVDVSALHTTFAGQSQTLS